MKIFLLVSYTCDRKSYCDKEFIENLEALAGDNPVLLVDNSSDDGTYFEKLKTLVTKAEVIRKSVPANPSNTRFQRSVADSVNYCRERFLNSECDYMLIVESDVIPPVDLLSKFSDDIDVLDKKITIGPERPWGILGALYYPGFHDYTVEGLSQTHHVLSGCTVYRRSLLQRYPFRYSNENLGAFPNAWICVDSGWEYTLWNDHSIHCKHLNRIDGSRH